MGGECLDERTENGTLGVDEIWTFCIPRMMYAAQTDTVGIRNIDALHPEEDRQHAVGYEREDII